MKILFLAQRFPYPPNKGDKLRSFNQIKHLSLSHDISLVCLSDTETDLSLAEEMNRYCRSVDVIFHSRGKSRINSLMGLFSTKPLTLSHFRSRKLETVVNRKLEEEQFDLVFVYCSSMAQYVEHVRHCPVIIDFVDVDSEKWRQYSRFSKFPMSLVYRLESKRLRTYERSLSEKFRHCFFVSEKEAEDFRTFAAPSASIDSLPNGVDGKTFTPSNDPYDRNSVVFTGAMDYFANVEAVLYFVDQIMPIILTRVPQLRFHIVGSNPDKEICRLPEKYSNISVTGRVDSVRPYVVNSSVFVAPMRIARGVQNKILEAMAMGVPVVSTSLGFEGINAIPGRDIFVEDTPEAFANQVVQLMTDPRLRLRTAQYARNVVDTFYDWQANLSKLDTLLSTVEGSGAAADPEAA